MDKQQHFEALEKMYSSAPVNTKIYPSTSIAVSENTAEIAQELNLDFFHAGKSLHGSVYFKLLDDAAYFAAASVEQKFFLLTKVFEISFLRPVTEGPLKATGRLVSVEGNEIKAKSVLVAAGKIVGKGNGVFAVSNMELSKTEGFS